MKQSHSQTAEGFSEMAQGIVKDVEKLVGQHFDLLRSELRQELQEARGAAVSLLGGAGAGALGGLLGAIGMVHLVHELTGLPLSVCYGLVGGGLGLLGGGLIKKGVDQVSEVDLVPRQTVRAVKENLTGSPA